MFVYYIFFCFDRPIIIDHIHTELYSLVFYTFCSFLQRDEKYVGMEGQTLEYHFKGEGVQ